MNTNVLTSKKIKDCLEDESKIQEIKSPAMRDAFQTVSSINKNDKIIGAYTKHSAHTKTSTKGCVMGCIGG